MDILGLFSRRGMLLGLGGAAAASAASAQAAGGSGYFARLLRPAGRGRSGGPLHTASNADWSSELGSVFTTDSGQALKLVDVQAYPRTGARPYGVREQGFVARFDSARGAELPEGRYVLSHPREGRFEIFLTKGGAEMPQRMLADFN
jgi:hypothetical protein